jgi:hypothetical protein
MYLQHYVSCVTGWPLHCPSRELLPLRLSPSRRVSWAYHHLCLDLSAWRCTTNRQGACVMQLKRLHGVTHQGSHV